MFPYKNWDSIASDLSLVMTGWHAEGIPQVPNPFFSERTGGALALVHWKELTSRIPKDYRHNIHAHEYPGRLPLQIIHLSEFGKLKPG